MAASAAAAAAPAGRRAAEAGEAQAEGEAKAAAPKQAAGGGALGSIGDFLGSSQGKAIQREVTRGVFGMLKKRL